MKKYTALFLALCLAFLCLSGCGSTEIRSYSADGTSSSDTRDMSAVYAAHKPDDVVMTVNGTEITWKEYFYWLNSCVTALDSDNGALIQDWTAACSHSSTGQSYAEYTLDRVKQAVVQYHVMDAKAKELGVELSDADKTSIASSPQKRYGQLLRLRRHGGGFRQVPGIHIHVQGLLRLCQQDRAAVLRHLRQALRRQR
jgi:hypothetical protein